MKVSIVTPVLNRQAMIGAALDSVRRQGIDACEHVVVDGGSQDGTQEAAASAGARVIEAPGSSIYEAINLGIGAARGSVIGLLNSDDLLAEGALRAVLSAFEEADTAADIVQGGFITVPLEGGATAAADLPAAVPPLDLSCILFGVPAINASFMARCLFDRVGPFDASLTIAADREWMARALLAGLAAKTVDRVVYVYRAHARSLTIGGDKAAELDWVREHLAFCRRYLADSALDDPSRRAFAAFHGKEVVHEAVLLLRQGRLGASAAALARGAATRAAWPAEALAPLLRVAIGRLRRAGAGGPS